MSIEAVTVYRTKGKEFDRFERAIEYRENLVEEFLRKSPGFQDMPYKSRIAFVESIITRRAELIALLNYSDRCEYENPGCGD
jgi:hypothetical protein